MGDEELPTGPVYTYTGDRAEGAVYPITAGEEPKVLTKDVTLLGPRSGAGEATYTNGDKYTGEYADGVRSGMGTYTYAAQPPPEEGEEPKAPTAVYEGKWKGGAKSGVGMQTFSSGEKYHGSFADGKFEGQGTMYYANGDLYTGEWVAGKKSGQGTYVYKASGARAQGTWEAGKLLSGQFADKFGNNYSGSFLPNGPASVSYGSGSFTLASDATSTARAPRLILMASDTPDKADFVGSLLPSVSVVEYDVTTASAADLVGLIRAATAKKGGPFESAALACHGDGPASGFAWQLSKKVAVRGAAAVGADVISVMTALGAATVPGGRVDLFACSLLSTPEGRAVFDAIQSATASHFAASDDLTGNSRKGLQDWVMESDGVNVKPLYFGDTSNFEGNFGKKEDEEMNIKLKALERAKATMAGCSTDAAVAVAAMATYTSKNAGDDVMLEKSPHDKFNGKAGKK